MSDYQDRFAPFVSKDKRPAKCYLLACTKEACFCDTVVTENLKYSWGQDKGPFISFIFISRLF